uniref:Cytochrome c oxidase subunit 3 n=1 Tax=Styela plicata TaxID=7726 RepID=D0Z5Q1_STYPL|nr:cytochrome c oxidase subunit III [Styela plicata]CAL24349.1 cytochrome c oxidase subunit III [Styela plicata]
MFRMNPFHLVDASPWPIMGSFGAMFTAFGLVIWFHLGSLFFMFFGVFLIVFTKYVWWRDVVREASSLGFHLLQVMSGLRIGMVLFITSEVLFFFGFFWTFFHSGLVPVVELGGVWPPFMLESLDPMAVPLLNTVVLLSSGVSVTYSHYSVINSNLTDGIMGLVITLFLGFFFTLLQAFEYVQTSFTIADSVYGSIFFMATGFHGFHVFVGSVFLLVCLVRMVNGHVLSNHHIGYECAIWYWHFVDVVWIFLYSFVYMWGG